MKLNLLHTDLETQIQKAVGFVSKTSQLPVLENIVLETEKNRLNIKATNLEISFFSSVGAKVAQSGKIAVPAKEFVEILKNISTETLELEVESESLKIYTENNKIELSGMNTSDFPEISQSISQKAIKLPSEEFRQNLSEVLFSVSRDETRPILTGVLFIFDSRSQKLILVSSDGFRLSKKELKVEGGFEDAQVVVPRNVLVELVRIVGEGDVLFEYSLSDNEVRFGFENSVLGSRLIEGQFPDFNKIIPKTSAVTASFEKEEFRRLVKMASIFAKDAANIVQIKVEEGKVKVSAESSKAGKQEGELPAKVEGEPITIAFNWRFIDEYLGVVQGEEVVLSLNSTTSPGVFKDPKNPDLLHLIMPVRLQD